MSSRSGVNNFEVLSAQKGSNSGALDCCISDCSDEAPLKRSKAKPRGRWVSAVLFEYTDSYENRNQTVTLVRGKGPSNYDDHYAWMVGKIKEQYPHAQEIEYVQSMTEKI